MDSHWKISSSLSASWIARLKNEWQHQYDTWKRRDLSNLELVYLWADGIYVKAGLEKDKAALLVIMCALSSGDKVILTVEDGYRESSESWSALLRDLKARALKRELARAYGEAFPKAVERMERDWGRMVTYYAFPREHWKHIRTTNVIESPFAAVRLRTGAAKRFNKVENATALIWKTLLVVEQNFRKLNAPHLLSAVYNDTKYKGGIRVRALKAAREQLAA